ncbi:MAG: TonB-dependent receptor [Gammaproteobacteria bacterium]
MNHSSRMIAALTGATFAIAPQFAGAQGKIEEIVVTARKKEETLQEVPVAISAFTGDQLEQQGIRAPGDLAREIPSLTIVSSSKTSDVVIFALRGQTASDVLLTVDQAVGTYFDGVNVPRPYGVGAGLVDVARIEVLKGPQGTLYGRNTTGGAVNIITRGADYDGIHGYAFVEAGGYANFRLNGAVNVPIIQDRLAVRLAYQHWQRDGYGESVITGQDLGGDKGQDFFRGSLLANPWENVQVEVKGEWLRLRENGYLQTPLLYIPQAATSETVALELGLVPSLAAMTPAARTTAQNLLTSIAARHAADIFTNSTNLPLHNDLDRYAINGTITVDFSENVKLKSITGYSEFNDDPVTDLDGTQFRILDVGILSPGPLGFPDFDLIEDRFFSQELNLSGNAFGDRLSWLAGVYYSNEKGIDTTTNDFRFARTGFVSPFTINFNQGVDIENTSWSLYSQNDYRFTDQLTFTFGGRYTEERHGITSLSRRFSPTTGLYVCNTAVTIVTANPNACATTRDAKFTGFSWLGSLNYQWNEDLLVYVKSAEGFRGGGWNLRLITAPPFEPETARDVEIGMKADWFDGRLRTNVALYRTEYSNKQESIIIPVGLTPQTVVQNAASAEIKGFEAEVFAYPWEGVSLKATVGYLDGQYDSFPGALTLTNQRVDATGERFANPPWQYSLSGRYERPLFEGTLGMEMNWAWTAGARPTPRLLDPALPPALVDDLVAGLSNFSNGRRDIGLLNVRVEYKMPAYGLSVAAFVNNALNEEYLIHTLSQISLGGMQGGMVAEPRMWGFQIKKTFGEE